MKIVAITQARMGSTRLPGKIMREVLSKPLLEYQIERVRRSKYIHQLVIATTIKETEQPIIDLCKKLNVDYYRGSEKDVLSRYFQAAVQYKADIVVRLTSDCPLTDPDIIDAVITEFLSNDNQYDYVSNTIERTYPRGLDVEVFSMKALGLANREAKHPVYREHVTPFIYLHPVQFHLGFVKNTIDLSSHRLTVDTEEDLDLISCVITGLYNKNIESFALSDIIELLQENPEWLLINSQIEQKKLDDEG
ncbi:cytidylyltransferase domain-containing protein [Peribacillus sp. NPDC056705]|uniref:cytidylyltransferase domain-containing protein n=1 Tax=Peribacillus sp. NPDC056705 TaxID=3345918 RepID=UPI003748784A